MLTIPQIKALLIVAGTSRPDLSGIRLEEFRGSVVAMATDGHRMLIIRSSEPMPAGVTGGFLPRSVAEGMVKAAGKSAIMWIHPDGTARCGDVSSPLQELSKLDWRRIVPLVSGKVAHFNFGYLGDFARIAKLLDCSRPVLWPNGDTGPALIRLGAEHIGVLMPIRLSDDDSSALPEWFTGVPAAAAVTAAETAS
jgi:hypothetical protein